MKTILLESKNENESPLINILVLQSYSIDANGRCEKNSIMDEFDFDNEELMYYENIEYPGKYKPSLLKKDSLLYLNKNKTDIVVQGIFRRHKPTMSANLTFRCFGRQTNINLDVIVTGDRHIDKLHSGLTLTDPTPFTEMPLRYDKAYGGTDEKAELKIADANQLDLMEEIMPVEEFLEISEFSYPRNPAGKGYLVDGDDIIGTSMPNLEFLNDRIDINNLVQPIENWGARPYPACFDWFPHAWFPRIGYFGYFTETKDKITPRKEIDLGLFDDNLMKLGIAERPKHGFVQGAHPYLWQNRLIGDEKIQISNLSKDGRDFLIELPKNQPRIRIKFLDMKEEEPKPELDLVFIEAELQQVTTVWRAMLPIKEKVLPNDWKEKTECKINL